MGRSGRRLPVSRGMSRFATEDASRKFSRRRRPEGLHAAKENRIPYAERFFEKDLLAGLESRHAEIQDGVVQYLDAMLCQNRYDLGRQRRQLLKRLLAQDLAVIFFSVDSLMGLVGVDEG